MSRENEIDLQKVIPQMGNLRTAEVINLELRADIQKHGVVAKTRVMPSFIPKIKSVTEEVAEQQERNLRQYRDW